MNHVLYYVHDPMCSWCYAFGPVWQKLQESLPATLRVERLLGGLAPDCDTPMDEAMRQRLESTWQRIEQSVPGIRFNFDFWRLCTPYRSTYNSCRAVIAASQQGARFDEIMTWAIQRAYYQQARNPSDMKTLCTIAAETGLDVGAFKQAVTSRQVEDELQRQIHFTRELGADSYPSLILSIDGSLYPIDIDYNDPAPMLDTILFLLGSWAPHGDTLGD